MSNLKLKIKENICLTYSLFSTFNFYKEQSVSFLKESHAHHKEERNGVKWDFRNRKTERRGHGRMSKIIYLKEAKGKINRRIKYRGGWNK